MFFYEWVIPFFTLLALLGLGFYLAVKNLTGAGIRTEGRVLFDQPDDGTDSSAL